MSVLGEANKISGEFREGIRRIARQGLTARDGSLRGTRKVLGYVCAIHEDGELAGTVDVQEFNYEPGEYDVPGAGHHRGVLLTAIPENRNGVRIVPMMYSEVVITQNPSDGAEYVVKFSYARQIDLKALSTKGDDDGKVTVGVVRVEDFSVGEEGLEKDCDELEPVGAVAITEYTTASITDTITAGDGSLTQEKTASKKTIRVGDTTVTVDGSKVSIETSGNVSLSVGGTSLEAVDGQTTIKTDKAVIEASNCEIKGSDVRINGSNVQVTGGTLKTSGAASTDLNGPYCAIKVCPFSGAPHCGSKVSGT